MLNSIDDFDYSFDDFDAELESTKPKAVEKPKVTTKNNSINLEKETEDNLNKDKFTNITDATDLNTKDLPSNNQSTDDIQTEKKKNMLLYIISDRSNPSMLDYFRGFGLRVSKIFTNLEEARDNLVMQVEPSKIVFVESGTGKFTSVLSRKILIDILGICDEDTEMMIFYTDSVVKSEVRDSGLDDKFIEWFKYKSTADVVANLLKASQTENYNYDTSGDKDKEDNKQITKDILNFKGLTLGKTNEQLDIDLGLPVIGVDEIRMHMMENESTDGLLKQYKIRV